MGGQQREAPPAQGTDVRALSLPAALSLLSVPSSLSSPGDVLDHEFLSSCMEIDWERRPSPPCTLWAFEFVSISCFLWLVCVEFDFPLSILVYELKGWFLLIM